MTYTCATIEVPPALFDILEATLRGEGYEHVIDEQGIDMTHLMVVKGKTTDESLRLMAGHVADQPAVHDALQAFSHDPTGEAGTLAVMAVLREVL